MIRLEVVRSGHTLKHKVMLGVGRFVFGAKPPDILRVLFHRHAYFGKPVGVLTHAVLRGPSEWSIGERELFAAYVSSKNNCRFCTVGHTAVARRALGQGPVDAAIAGNPPPELGPKTHAMLPYLEKLTLDPEQVSAADVQRLREAGISNEAILDASYIVMLFCMYNRIVDAIGCEPMDPKQAHIIAQVLLEKGYDM